MVNVFVTDAETGNRQHGGAMGQDESLDLLEQQTVFEAVVVSATDSRGHAHRLGLGHRRRSPR